MSSSDRLPLSWKKIFIGLPILLVLIFLADRGVFRCFLNLEKSGARFQLEKKLQAIPEKEKYEVLVFGTSRAFSAIQPNFVNPIIGTRLFKESYVGKGPKYNYYFYQTYKKIFGVPKVVVYGLDYFLFLKSSQPSLLQRFPECEDVSETGDSVPLLLLANKERIDQYVNDMLNRIQEKAPDHIRKFNPEKNFMDMETYVGVHAPKKTKVISEVPPNFNKKKAAYAAFPGKEGVYYLKLLKELKKDNVTIFLVTIPYYIGSYRTQKGPKRFIQDHANLLKSLDYKGRAFFADYNDPKRFPMDDVECFLDGGYGLINSHLSIKGSKIFCDMFSKDLKNILEKTRLP